MLDHYLSSTKQTGFKCVNIHTQRNTNKYVTLIMHKYKRNKTVSKYILN